MGERWIPEAERLTPAGTSGTMSGKGGPRATLHCCVSRPDQFNDMHAVLTGKEAEPHLLYAFASDRLGQYFPLDVSARALMGRLAVPSGVSHNRVGTVNIQIEVVGSTDDWTARADWRPGPKFRAMMRAIASWGVRPEFIYRTALTSTDRANVVRSFATMTGDAGGWKWWGHCHYPDGESHWDPGRVNLARFFAAAQTATSPLEDDMSLTPAQTDRLNAAVDRILGAVPEGAFLTTRLDSEGKNPRVLDSADGGYLVALLKSIAEKIGAPVDIDEAALATDLVERLREPLLEVIRQAPPGATAEEIVDELAARMAPPPAA